MIAQHGLVRTGFVSHRQTLRLRSQVRRKRRQRGRDFRLRDREETFPVGGHFYSDEWRAASGFTWARRSGSAFGRLARLEEEFQKVRMVFKKLRQVRQHSDRRRAEVMLDAFDVLLLGFWTQPEQRKETGQSFVPLL